MRPTRLRAAVTPLAALALSIALSLTLSGCLGGLLGGGKPSQMYRLGATTGAAAAEGAAPAATRTIELPPITFAPEIDTDRLLASRGAETFYIKNARWAATAAEMFAGTLRDAFRRHAPGIALVDRRSAAATVAVIQIAVDRFEARYTDAGKDAVPTIRIEGSAMLSDPRARAPAARYRFAAEQPATSGRIDDVVAAFDAANGRVVTAVADWASRQP